jgi:hypothetical protein
VDSPTSTVFAVTAIEIGEVDLTKPDNLPHENLPIGFEVLLKDVSPTTDVSDFILQVIIPTVPLEEN